jgi:hypothetical protein
MSNFSLNSAAVRRYLARALTGDTERPRPPVTLAGQQHSNGSVAIPPSGAAPAPTPIPTRPIHDRPKSNDTEPEPGDEQWAYSREQLIRMDYRFRTRLLRAIERGQESGSKI